MFAGRINGRLAAALLRDGTESTDLFIAHDQLLAELLLYGHAYDRI